MPSQSHPFLLFLEQHREVINRICRSFARGNADDEADLRQEVVIRLWINWATFRHESKPITWMWRVAYTAAIDWWRRERRHSLQQTLPDFDTTETADIRAQLEELLSTLTPNEYNLMRLYLDGWSQAEIAQMLNTTETGVASRIYRIKNKLKKVAAEAQPSSSSNPLNSNTTKQL